MGRPAASTQRRCVVLLVDDQSGHRLSLRRALLERGHDVHHAADGAAGEALCRGSLKVDALVACADMEHMGGFELARRVLRMRPEARVLLMWPDLARPDESETRRASEQGFALIERPFTPEDLCRRLAGLLDSRRDGAAAVRLQPPGDVGSEA